ncbi:transglycosylase domain-containing protein [Alicyclobacillus tolerans]|uniref:transglycosylase domain-containing protein n=1 Tax=Alicyclobacillus tolerans TaxID=90970 RepID=UPI001F2ECBDB|nr:transglycosylase domain-containing protein [Alicyclobacillus tolerans]MCF8566539.1 transglycosylase domain-containing protein [Alicyclobacillus tolerans]
MKTYFKVLLTSATGVAVLMVAGAIAFSDWIKNQPLNTAALTNPPGQTVVYDGLGQVYMKVGTVPSNLTYNQLPHDLVNAIVATEDHTFWSGSTLDIRSLIRAALVDISAGQAAQGASTIPEQLAKIVYLNDNKTISYKLKEIELGMQLNRYFTKQQILAMYMNKVFLGENTIGVEQAALRYFGVNIKSNPNALTLSQAALLAGLPQAPTSYDPIAHPKSAMQRRNEVLQNMVKYGYITQTQANAAEKQPLGVKYHSISSDSWNTHPLFTNFLLDYAAKHGISEQRILRGGLKIYTTIDPRVQKAVHQVFWGNQYDSEFPGPTSGTVVQGAAVFVDPKTGNILGAAGSRQQGFTPLGMDRIYSNSSPGSSIKPIMEYAPAIQSGKWTPSSILDNTPHNFGDGYTPQNWEGPNGPAKVTLQYGLQWSQNVASVWLLQQIGINTGANFAEKDGIQLTAKDREHLGIAIGGMQNGVNAFQMAQAYEAFDNNGVQMSAHLISKVVNQDGNVLYNYTPVLKTIMTPATATTMTRLLQDVVDYGTGTSAKVPGVSVAGKTGTVQYSPGLTGYTNWVRNAWFDGYTPRLVGSIYLGYDNPSPTHHLTMAPLDPSANAAEIFGTITRLALQYGYPGGAFSAGPFPASGAAVATTSKPKAAKHSAKGKRPHKAHVSKRPSGAQGSLPQGSLPQGPQQQGSAPQPGLQPAGPQGSPGPQPKARHKLHG